MYCLRADVSYFLCSRLTATSEIRSRRYYGHFFGCLAKTTIHFLVKQPSLIRPNFFGPLVTVLTGFHCSKMT